MYIYNLKTLNAAKAFITSAQGVIVTVHNIRSLCRELRDAMKGITFTSNDFLVSLTPHYADLWIGVTRPPRLCVCAQ